MIRRICGLLNSRLPELELPKMKDFRRRRGKRWPLQGLFSSMLVSMMSGCKSLAEMEHFTQDISSQVRRLLKIERRVPDTTMRDVLVKQSPHEARRALRSMIKAAHRRKALESELFPFGVISIDGKAVALPSWDHPSWDHCYAQEQSAKDGKTAHGLLRTHTCTLTSCMARPIVEVIPIPADTNEMGHFQATLEILDRHYGNLFQLITHDAGASSEANAKAVVDLGKDYLFRLNNENWGVQKRVTEVLKPRSAEQADAMSQDAVSNSMTVVRRIWLHSFPCGMPEWRHLKTVIRVQSQVINVQKGTVETAEDRYYCSSLQQDRLSSGQWLSLVRHHWSVEVCHNVLDTSMEEDNHPWILTNPKAALVVLIFRRIAYNLLTLFRSVTQRSEEKKSTSWKRLIDLFRNAFIAATRDHLKDLRPRKELPVTD
jgi:hypothetical protein